jgi:hypothetical protein
VSGDEGDPIRSFKIRSMLMPIGQCLGGNPGLIRNIGDRAPGKNGLRQVVKDIGNTGVLVNSMNSLDHALKVRDGWHSRKMKMATQTKSAMARQVVASQKLEKPFRGEKEKHGN